MLRVAADPLPAAHLTGDKIENITKLQPARAEPRLTKQDEEQHLWSHIPILWSATALRWDPVDILIGVLDITCLAVNAVRGVDEVTWRLLALIDPLVNACRAEACRGTSIDVVF